MRKSNGIVKTLKMNRMSLVNKLVKKASMFAALVIIFVAITSSVFRSLTPWAEQYKGKVETLFSNVLGQTVTIQKMNTAWYWFHPVLKLERVTITDGSKSIRIEKLLVGINIVKSLWYRRIQPGILYLNNTDLTLRQKDGYWSVDGLAQNNSNDVESLNKTKELLAVLASQEKLIIRHVSVHFNYSDGHELSLHDLNLSIVNRSSWYKFRVETSLVQKINTQARLLGDLFIDPYHLEETKGKIYLDLKQLDLSQWQNMLPPREEKIDQGVAQVSLWLDLHKGALASVQSQLRLDNLVWHLTSSSNTEKISSFFANMRWKKESQRWSFDADQIKLTTPKHVWPENELSLSYNGKTNKYSVYIKTLIIDSILSPAISWPDVVKKILPFNPHGTLKESRLVIKGNKVDYLLTAFNQLGWGAQGDIPQIDNLSGVIEGQPEEGHLEWDSENVVINAKDYPQQQISQLNGALYWKQLNEGLRISVDRFVLIHPQLTISAQAVLDQMTNNSIGNIRLNMDYAAKNVTQWFVYLPKKHIKPKLYFWLTHQVKKIDKATGTIKINGQAKDFPFEENKGEFSIVSHAVGGSLRINAGWPLATKLEAYLRLKNRDLDIDLVHGDLKGIPIDQMNLKIADIGHDKETLLLHAIIKGKGQKILEFVLASPLKERLARLAMMSLKNSLLVNLNLEIPLYPENDDNLVKGQINFNNNKLELSNNFGSLEVAKLTGELVFDQEGIVQGQLQGESFDYPLMIKIDSVKTSNPYARFIVKGESTVESLEKRFKLQHMSYLKGLLAINAELRFSRNPKNADSIIFRSNLEGLTVNLPDPLGKTAHVSVPSTLTLDLNPDGNLRLNADYNSLLSADMLFKTSPDFMGLESGQIRLGSALAVNQNTSGLEVTGALDGFNLQDWKNWFMSLPQDQQSFALKDKLTLVDVTLNKLTVLKQSFDQFSIKAKLLKNQDWSFALSQKKVSADLTYHHSSNQVAGFVRYLHLDPISLNKTLLSSTSINPSQIPNLNLRVDNLTVGKIQVGNVILKSTSSANKWLINYGRIETPDYQFNVNGEWTQQGKSNQTKMQLSLHSTDLAKSLERWDIPPAVDAKKGDMQFQGGWNGSIFDFALGHLDGQLFIQLNNGRITHLSPETEEKLGLGKLLSVLSLQTIPRRLKLDFSDLAHDGYSFDEFKGNFTLKKGVMNTQDSSIEGPVAYASMTGDLDLVKRLYDLDLNISPHITASLPVVATIAGGPIAGLATWVAGKIINQGMQKISAYTYKISGPWNQPVVQQLRIVKGHADR